MTQILDTDLGRSHLRGEDAAVPQLLGRFVGRGQVVIGQRRQQPVPEDLKRFVREKVETNPFYLEEMINSLIESGI